MRASDLLGFAVRSLLSQGLRGPMLLLAMAISVASVLLLIALGQGAKSYVEKEFAFIGRDLLVMLPGRKETTGTLPPLTGAAARELTLDDMAFLAHRLPRLRFAPLVVGQLEVAFGGRAREVMTLGTTAEFFETHHLRLLQGRGLPPGDPRKAQAVCVLGGKLAEDLFGNQSPLGQQLRLGPARCRVLGIFGGTGSAMGVDISDDLLVPVASAEALFDTQGLFRLFIQSKSGGAPAGVRAELLRLIAERHQGEADVTLISPDALLATFGDIMTVLTAAVSGIAAISLAVAGILLMNISLINVQQRIPEVGLLKALGAGTGQVRAIFLCEAALLSGTGALLGMVLGESTLLLAAWFWPEFPLHLVPWSLPAAMLLGIGVGLLFSWLPARRAARLEPVTSLRGGR
ncbi:ABC transporter permease [Gallaecimonas kandeliae]|uniref:ABC transporter permease n=1 Tax=Gallaecimonas kandeliae TaxID=3029055 RepID=UPI0026479FEF|nr:ABC transporter permease [Gallaecimonas kandeliae]WKE66856.1 ABC transporter permease [Gallaecimonas kandeliae]